MKAKDLTDFQVDLQLFAGYNDPDAAIFSEFAFPEARPQSGFITDFVGSRIRSTSVWREARKLDGQLLGLPIPGDFHAEAVEWIGLLKTVRAASGQYVAMELGAGFGPWIIAGAVAARRRGIEDIRLCAAEGDSQHFASLRQHFIDNGFEPDKHLLIEAAVGTHAGTAQWPVLEESEAREEWGLRPIEPDGNHSGEQRTETKPVKVIPMLELVMREPYWNLIHIDVQGKEVEICRSCIDALNARAGWLIVGTHSRKLDGDLLELMAGAGWFLEHEKPAKFTFVPDPVTLEAMTTLDGTQVWRNPRLTTLREGDPLTSFSQAITCSTREIHAEPGGTYVLEIALKNTGTQPWFGAAQRAPVNAGYRWLDASGNVLPIEGNRTPLRSAVVRPGSGDVLQLNILAPIKPGSYTLWISMVQEGVAWFFDKGAEALAIQATVK